MTKPSFQDYGTYDESAHPDLWDGVVGYWAPCLGPSGTRLHDVSRFNNWGTLTNMDAATDWVIDSGQYALDFDGTNDHVSCGIVPIGGACTVSCWTRPASNVPTRAIFSDTTGAGFTGALQFEIGRTQGKFSLLWANTVILYSDLAPTMSQQYHVVGVRRGTTSSWTAEFWIDGKLNSSATTTNNPGAANAFSIGQAGSFPGQYYSGQISDIAAWNRALAPNEIRNLYQLGRGGMLERRRRRRVYSVQADVVKSYLFVNRGQVIGGGTL
jgi:hypothetical protein